MADISSSEELLEGIREAIPQIQEWLNAPGKRPAFIAAGLLQIVESDLKRMEGEVAGNFVPPKAHRPDLIGRVLRYEGLASQGIHPLVDLLIAVADYYKYKLPG